MVLQILVLVQSVISRLVNVQYHFTKSNFVTGGDGQWGIDYLQIDVSAKGLAITDAIATIMHYGLDFVAQFSLLLPGVASTTYDTTILSSFEIP